MSATYACSEHSYNANQIHLAARLWRLTVDQAAARISLKATWILREIMAKQSIVENVRLAAPVYLNRWCDQYQPCPVLAKLVGHTSWYMLHVVRLYNSFAVRLRFPYLTVVSANRIARHICQESMSLIGAVRRCLRRTLVCVHSYLWYSGDTIIYMSRSHCRHGVRGPGPRLVTPSFNAR